MFYGWQLQMTYIYRVEVKRVTFAAMVVLYSYNEYFGLGIFIVCLISPP